jgi:EAL domain-containing protein (putative c-di-GMP-specific phosphodiesterase class I)
VQTGPAPTATRAISADWADATERLLRDEVRPDLVAQPIVDLSAGRTAGFELLARFPGPPDAPPDAWFALADRLGRAAALTAQVLDRALALRATLPPDTFLTVNVEPHLVVAPEVAEVLRGQSLARIVIELTEHTQAPDGRALERALARVREAGGLVAVDDAGTGYAGLQQLLTVRPDIVKVDRDLVTGLDADPIRRSLVELLGDLTGRMDAWLLAEGVETTAELQALASLGVPLGQGWRLGRPAPPWATLAPETAEDVRLFAAQATFGDHVAALMRACLTASLGDHIDADPGTVLVDADGRPAAILVPAAGGGVTLAPAMTVAPSSGPVEVARRALAREVAYRGVPVVCTNGRGYPVGVVDTADLVEAVIRLSSG